MGWTVTPEKSLAYKNPSLAAEWHTLLNGTLTPNDVFAVSGRRVWWQCHKKHEWEAKVSDRSYGNGCPTCSGRRVSADNNLAAVHSDIAGQWHPTKNAISPTDVVAHSHTEVWWKCVCGHEWKAQVKTRCEGHGCPVCNKASRGERAIADTLAKLDIAYQREVRFDSCRDKYPLPFDFVVKSGELTAMIEFHGIQHFEPVSFASDKTPAMAVTMYEGVQRRDNIKRKWCEDQKVRLLEIPYTQLENVEGIVSQFVMGMGANGSG